MIDFSLPIIGTAIVIRAMREEDVEALYNLDTDKDVKRYVGGALTRPRQECVEGMRGFCTTPGAVLPLIVACKVTGNFVGRAVLSPEDTDKQCFEIQVLLAKNYWGKHLGREPPSFSWVLLSTASKPLRLLRLCTRKTRQAWLGRWDNGHYVFERKFGAP
jgi:hypothetical protein